MCRVTIENYEWWKGPLKWLLLKKWTKIVKNTKPWKLYSFKKQNSKWNNTISIIHVWYQSNKRDFRFTSRGIKSRFQRYRVNTSCPTGISRKALFVRYCLKPESVYPVLYHLKLLRGFGKYAWNQTNILNI